MEVLELETLGIIGQEFVPAKTKTQLLLEKMERGEYVSDYEYLSSIPGYIEELDEEANDPNKVLIPLSEVWPDV